MRVSICCIASELEKPYIDEWISYHLNLGIDKIYIYQNNTVFVNHFKDKVQFIQFDGHTQQLNAYNDFIDNYSYYYDFGFFIDCDEFIKIRSKRNLKEILTEYNYYPALGINWRLFGDSHIHKVINNDYSIKRFHLCDKTLNQHIKQCLNFDFIRKLVLPIKFLNPHFSTLQCVNQEKEFIFGPFNNKNLDQVHELELNHYITKSRDECEIRRSFIRADTPSPREEGWFTFYLNHNKNDIEEGSLIYV